MKKCNFGPRVVSVGRGLARIVFVATLCSLGNSAPDQWVTLLPPQSGAITASTPGRDLVNRFGARNVSDGGVDVGEGETAPGTTVFPGDPIRAIDILWKDPKTKRSPHTLSIGGKASQWKTAHGISLGTSLKELEQINGKPFGYLDSAGTTLARSIPGKMKYSLDFEGHGRVILRLDTDLVPPNRSRTTTTCPGTDHSPLVTPRCKKSTLASTRFSGSFHNKRSISTVSSSIDLVRDTFRGTPESADPVAHVTS
jgi:hypothetical protein